MHFSQFFTTIFHFCTVEKLRWKTASPFFQCSFSWPKLAGSSLCQKVFEQQTPTVQPFHFVFSCPQSIFFHLFLLLKARSLAMSWNTAHIYELKAFINISFYSSARKKSQRHFWCAFPPISFMFILFSAAVICSASPRFPSRRKWQLLHSHDILIWLCFNHTSKHSSTHPLLFGKPLCSHFNLATVCSIFFACSRIQSDFQKFETFNVKLLINGFVFTPFISTSDSHNQEAIPKRWASWSCICAMTR